MTPDQLREWNATRPFPHPNEAQEIIFEGHRCVVMDPECYEACFKQAESHAAALEEIDRLKRDLEIMIGRADNEERAMERAEKAERRAERLKFHAEAMANYLTIDGERCQGPELCPVCEMLAAYRADKGG